MKKIKRGFYKKQQESALIVTFCILFSLLFILFASIVNASTYSLDEWADAIFKAEGSDAVVPYGMFFKGCDWEHENYCRKIVKNTVFNTLVKYREVRCRDGEDDVLCLSRRYCPLDDPRDKNGLNKNWAKNVRWFLENQK